MFHVATMALPSEPHYHVNPLFKSLSFRIVAITILIFMVLYLDDQQTLSNLVSKLLVSFHLPLLKEVLSSYSGSLW